MKSLRHENSIHAFCHFLAHQVDRLGGDTFTAGETDAIPALVRARLIVPAGVAATAVCNECDTHHLVDVVPNPAGSGHGWYCPDAGFVAAEPERVAAFAVSAMSLVEAVHSGLCRAFGSPRRTRRPLETPGAWVLGAWEVSGAWTTVVLAGRAYTLGQARQLSEELDSLPYNDAELILSADVGARLDAVMPRRTMIYIGDVFAVSADNSVVLDKESLATAISRSLSRSRSTGGRPSAHDMVEQVLDLLTAQGLSPDKVNAGTVARSWDRCHVGAPPSRSTIRLHIRTWRSKRR